MTGTARQILDRATFVEAVDASDGQLPLSDLEARVEPVILRGLVRDWPLVAAAKTQDGLLAYLRQYDAGANVTVSVGKPSLAGRIFYNDGFTGPNADRGTARMSEVLSRLEGYAGGAPSPTVYMASTDIRACLPGMEADNRLDFGHRDTIASIWLGNRTRIAAHNDLPLNVACVASGRRRFILFPPDQTPNLYVGPFESTPAGRPISFVDFADPDFGAYPKFEQALDTAYNAELEAGDALFIPSMWWHHVEALDDINILINYWWRTVPSFMGTPQDVLTYAMWVLRDLPEKERENWQHMFDHYVFGASDENHRHIPEHLRGVLSPINEERARTIRAFLLNRLNR